jgi:MFS family permease
MFHKRLAFYLIIITQTLSLIGSRLTAVGMGIWVFQNTGNTTPVLLTAFFAELPGMLGGSLAGVLVDRWDRRKVMILADSGQAFGSLLLVASLLSGQFQVWHLYLVSFIQGVFGTFQQPAEDAAMTMLVPENKRDRGNAIRQMAFPLAGVVATGLAGLFFVWIGITGIILIDLVSFLVAVTAVLLVAIPKPEISPEGLAASGNWLRELKAGLQYFIKRRQLLLLVLYLTFINFLLNGPLSLDIPYLLSKTSDEKITGTLMAMMSLGAFTGAGLIALRGKIHRRVVTMLTLLLISALMFLVLGISNKPWVLGASLFLLMIPLPVMNALIISLLQAKTPADMQGRIFSAFWQLGYLGSTASFLLTGQLVDKWLEPMVATAGWSFWAPLVGDQPGSGMGLLLVATGLLMLLSTLAMLASRSIRRLESDLPDYVTDGGNTGN